MCEGGKMNKKIILYIIILFSIIILSFNSVISLFISSMNNSLSSENLTFTGNQNITRYLSLPKNSNVTNATINFTGLEAFGDSAYIDTGYNKRIYGMSRNDTSIFVAFRENNTVLNITTWDTTGLVLKDSFTVNASLTVSSGGGCLYNDNNAPATLYYCGGDGVSFNGLRNLSLTTKNAESSLGANNYVFGFARNGTYLYTLSTSGGIYRYNSNGSNADWASCGGAADYFGQPNYSQLSAQPDPRDGGMFMIDGKLFINQDPTTFFEINLSSVFCDNSAAKLRFIISSNITLPEGATINFLSIGGYFYNNTRQLFMRKDLTSKYEIFNFSYPRNTFLEIGTPNNIYEWNYTSSFNKSNNKTSDLSSAINANLTNCLANSSGYCDIPLLFHSDTASILTYSDIQIQYYTYPNITLTSPSNNSGSGINQSFIGNFSDFTSLKNSTFYIWNSTNSLYNQTNFTITGFSNYSSINITFNYSDTFKWNFRVCNNESYCSFGVNSSLIVDISNPVTNLNFPTNNRWLNYSNIGFNCTTTGTNLDSGFLYGNFNGSFSKNQTKKGITNGILNNFNLSVNDGSYLWTCGANSTITSTITLSQSGNFTVNIDTIFPNVSINSLTTTAGSQTISFNSTSTDINTISCKYSIFNSSNGIDGLNNNVSYTCNSSKQATTTNFGNYNLTIYAVDLANNENSATLSFVTSLTQTTSTGGGGGAPENKIPVIGLNDINGSTIYNALQREAIYSSINNYCSNKIRKEPLALIDYSDICSLTTDDLRIVKADLEKLDIKADLNDLFVFFQSYKKSSLFQGFETQATIDAYKLFTSVLGITNLLTLNPSSIDKPVIINTNGQPYTISYSIYSNKPLIFCEVITNPDFSCSVANTTVLVKYHINNTDFLSKIFTGSISVTTDAPLDKIEIKKLPITFRVYNIGGTIGGMPFWAIILISTFFIIGITVFIFKKYKKKGLKTAEALFK